MASARACRSGARSACASSVERASRPARTVSAIAASEPGSSRPPRSERSQASRTSAAPERRGANPAVSSATPSAVRAWRRATSSASLDGSSASARSRPAENAVSSASRARIAGNSRTSSACGSTARSVRRGPRYHSSTACAGGAWPLHAHERTFRPTGSHALADAAAPRWALACAVALGRGRPAAGAGVHVAADRDPQADPAGDRRRDPAEGRRQPARLPGRVRRPRRPALRRQLPAPRRDGAHRHRERGQAALAALRRVPRVPARVLRPACDRPGASRARPTTSTRSATSRAGA